MMYASGRCKQAFSPHMHGDEGDVCPTDDLGGKIVATFSASVAMRWPAPVFYAKLKVSGASPRIRSQLSI